jgi:long-chain acyl-CoA synthetase
MFAMGIEFGCYGPSDRALAVAPMYHGAGFAFALAPIFFGGSLLVHERFDPELLLRDLADWEATNVFLVPTHFQAVFSLGQATLEASATPALRTIISNAAPLSQPMKERIVEKFGGDVLFECYGSTEAAIVSALRPADQLIKQSCVGQPFPLTEVILRDEAGVEVGPGEVGELFSRSPYLFTGYWQRPQETAVALGADGFCTSGDLAMRDEDGHLYIVDRKNDKIISGGVNIFPREIEDTLLRHPAVSEVAVYGVPDDYWGEAVEATIVPKAGVQLDVEELLVWAQALGRYKLPRHVAVADTLPRNAAGKVLRRELRVTAAARRAGEAEKPPSA